jgi:small acid-soluble spore protein F (minor alpha/beta-type SASP)
MKSNKGKPKKKKELKPEDIMKYEIAKELGLGDKLSAVGWGGLTAEETGRIGGIITRRKKEDLMQNTGRNIENKV